jgi:hypothetical protein
VPKLSIARRGREMRTANVLRFKKPEEEPEYIRAVKKQLALLTEVQIELDRETSRLLYFLKQYEESK